jgi:LmbE family N-acetylglucosaminyl deacetylase
VNVLAIVAHPDDESLWAGGTLALHVKRGDLVMAVALSDGVGSREGATPEDSERRRQQFVSACQILGVHDDYAPLFHDQRADTMAQLTLNRAVEHIVGVFAPAIVYTHHAGDLNSDHRKVAEAVLVATRPGCSAVREVFHMRPEWPDRCVGPAWVPKAVIDITETLEQKILACLCYTDELRPYPHPRSEQALRAEAVEWFMRTAS